MSAEKVARLIADFDRPEAGKPRSRIVPFDQLQHSGAKPLHHPLLQPAASQRQPQQPAMQPPAMQPKSIEAVADEAFSRGLEQGEANVRAEFEQEFARQRQEFEAKLVEERERLLGEAAANFTTEITEVGHQLQARIAGVAARILEPLISSAMQKQAATTFIEHLSSISTDVRRPVLRISGPAELLDLIRGKLGVRAIAVEMRPGPELEASITVDQAVLETQLKIWGDRLKLAVQA